jgi:O-antigen/teichoic acid export membrane protein
LQPGPAVGRRTVVPERHEPALAARVGEAMVWNSVAAPIKAGLTLAASVVIARMLGPDRYGAYAVTLSLLTFLGQYTDLGINRSLPRYLPQAEVRFGQPGVRALLRDVLLLKVAIVVVTAVLLAALSPRVAEKLRLGADGIVWIQLVVVVFACEVFREIALRVLNSYLRQKLTNSVEMLTLAIHPLASALVLWLGGGVGAVLAATAAQSALAVALLGTAARRVVRDTPSRAPLADPHGLSRQMVPHAATNYTLLVTKFFAELPFVVFLMAWAGTDKAAIGGFAIAYKIVGMSMNLLAIPLQSVQVPLMARMDAVARPGALSETWAALAKYLVFALAPGISLIEILAPEVIVLLYGNAYREAATWVRILAPLLALETLFNLSSNVLIIKGDYRELVSLRGAALAMAPFVVAAAFLGGPAAVALTIGTGRALLAFAGYSIAARRYRLAFPVGFVSRVCLAALGLWIAAMGMAAWAAHGWVAVGARVLAGGVGFLLAFRLLGGFDADEKRLLAHFPVPGVDRLLRWM